MLDKFDQNNFLKDFFKNFLREQGNIFGNYTITKGNINFLVDKLLDAMNNKKNFFNYYTEYSPVKEKIIELPYSSSKDIEKIIQALYIMHGYNPALLEEPLINLLRTKYKEMKEQEEKEAEKQRKIEEEKREFEAYQRLKLKYEQKK